MARQVLLDQADVGVVARGVGPPGDQLAWSERSLSRRLVEDGASGRHRSTWATGGLGVRCLSADGVELERARERRELESVASLVGEPRPRRQVADGGGHPDLARRRPPRHVKGDLDPGT